MDMSRIEKGLGNYALALQHYELYSHYADSLEIYNENKSLAALQKKYDYEKFQRENFQLKAEKQWRGILAVCFAVVLVLALAIVYYVHAGKSTAC